MNYKVLYIFVEGDDDEDFFRAIKEEIFGGKYNCIQIVKYAQKDPEYVEKFIKSIKAMKADYIFVADIDKFPCITARKANIRGKYSFLDNEKILIVVKEIESWYLAGVDQAIRKKLKIKCSLPSTDDLTKEELKSLMPKKFLSFRTFLQELLKHYELQTARRNNKSFDYFLRKY
ncbi:hypothetical protein H5T87_07500 [bacterium]|nr:hypothetical protein [bacterium]